MLIIKTKDIGEECMIWFIDTEKKEMHVRCCNNYMDDFVVKGESK